MQLIESGRFAHITMSKSQIAIRLPQLLLEKLNRYISETGMSKTDVVTNALAQYLDCEEQIPLTQRVSVLEKRLADLELLVKAK